MSTLLRALTIIAGLVVLVGVGAFMYLRASLPMLQGELDLAGLSGTVEVIRDRHAVPHIFANSTEDGLFALGYVHAQDRLWQMEVQRRLAAGRLAEVVGEAAVGSDRFLRTLSVYHYAEQALPHLNDEVRAWLSAYVSGINAYLDSRSGPLPPEFVYFRHEPEPWQKTDVIVWAKMMAWDLSGNWSTEVLRARLAQRLTTEELAELWPAYPDDGPVTIPADESAAGPLQEAGGASPFGRVDTFGGASNAWAVAGEHTRSGMPLLASDPHLRLQAPSMWYLAHVSTPEYTAIGATLPGAPGILMGHNGHLSWGLTSVGADVQDVYIERLAEDDPGSYEAPEGNREFVTRDEVIRVRDGADVALTVRQSRHGPVISDVDAAAAAAAQAYGPDHVAVLRWTALQAEDPTIQGFLNLPRATSWETFRSALEDLHAPALNFVYADVEGNIGYQLAGAIPVRSGGDGGMPVFGWTAEYDWERFIPFDELPQSFNPDGGRLVNANEKVVGADYPHLITRDWADPYRAERIHGLLDQVDLHTVDSFARIQRDHLSLMARAFLPTLTAIEPQGEQERRGHALLQDWDGTMAKDGPEPLIFYGWYREFTRAILADRLGELMHDYWSFRPRFFLRVLDEQQDWCNDIRTPAVESCAYQASMAFSRALDALTERFGSNVEAWRWGEAHAARHAHGVFTGTPLGRFFDLVTRAPGDAFTIAAARFDMRRPEPFEQVSGATFRAVYDLENLDRSRYIQSTGQSGNPVSLHYRDFVEPFRDGSYLPMTTSRSEIERESIGRLLLRPP